MRPIEILSCRYSVKFVDPRHGLGTLPPPVERSSSFKTMGLRESSASIAGAGTGAAINGDVVDVVRSDPASASLVPKTTRSAILSEPRSPTLERRRTLFT